MSKLSRERGHKAMAEILSVHDALRQMLLPTLGRSRYSMSFYAATLGVPESTLYQWAEGRMEMPASMVVPVTRATRDVLLLNSMEAACGRVGIQLPSGEDLELGSIRRVIREFGELVETACEAAEDGEIDESEFERVRTEGLAAIAAIHSLIQEFHFRAGEGQARETAGGHLGTLAEASRQETPKKVDGPGGSRKSKTRQDVH